MALEILKKPFALIGPSGSERTVIAFRLTCDLPHKFHRIVSMSSRKPWLIQKLGFHFNFYSEQEKLLINNNNQFISLVLHSRVQLTSRQKLQLSPTIIIRRQSYRIKKNIGLKQYSYSQSYFKFIREYITDEIDCLSLYINFINIKSNNSKQKLYFGPFDQVQINQSQKMPHRTQRQTSKYLTNLNIIHKISIKQALIQIKSCLLELPLRFN